MSKGIGIESRSYAIPLWGFLVAMCFWAGVLGAKPFVRGDANNDGEIDIADPIATLSFLFAGNQEAVPCKDHADANDSGEVDIDDPIYVLTYLFAGGSRPRPPFPRPGFDGTSDPYPCGDVIGGPHRPVTVHVPQGYDESVPMPLVLLLHAAKADGAWQEGYMKFLPLATSEGFLYAHPNGTIATAPSDPALGPLSGETLRAWNAGGDFGSPLGHEADDLTYLEAVIQGAKIHYNVDPNRVFLIGHSSGGNMAHGMACHCNDVVAAIATFAGVLLSDPNEVSPSGGSIHVLVINGTKDRWVGYDGGSEMFSVFADQPGAPATTEQWAVYNGCSLVGEEAEERLDLDSTMPGAETRIRRYTNECHFGGSAELWTIEGGRHVPILTPHGQSTNFAKSVIDWLLAHPKR